VGPSRPDKLRVEEPRSSIKLGHGKQQQDGGVEDNNAKKELRRELPQGLD